MALVGWRWRTGLACAALPIAMAVGCGEVQHPDDPDGGGTGVDAGGEPVDASPVAPCEPGGDPSYEEAWRCLQEGYCRRISACFSPFELDDCLGFPLAIFGLNDRIQIERVREAIAERIIEYHPERVADCVALENAAECRLFAETAANGAELCPVFTGTIPDGEACFDALECATPGALCAGDQLCNVEELCCARACVPPAGLAEDCAGRACVSGAYCIGGVCRPGETGSPCAAVFDCDVDFWCDVASGTCQPDADLDGVCVQDEQCPAPQRCLGDDLPESAGGTCGRADRLGDPCDDLCYGFACKRPVDGGLGTCVPYGTEGASCADVECAPSFRCDGAMCVPRGRIGDPCVAGSDECLQSLSCVPDPGGGTGRCAGLFDTGESCGRAEECASAICDESTLRCEDFPGCYP